MFNLNTLDTVIAVVIVLLVLSLIVQSAQQALKKLFKIKSRQIEDSLVDLFEHVLGATPQRQDSWLMRIADSSPILRWVFRRPHPSEHDPQVSVLFREVMIKFRELGRAAQSGKVMLDSIARQDLLKVLGEVAPTVLTPNFAERLRHAYNEFLVLEKTLSSFDPARFSQFLSEDAKSKLAEMQGALRPLLNDIRAYDLSAYLDQSEAGKTESSATDKQPPSVTPTPSKIIADLIGLREVRLGNVRQLLSEAEKQVEQELAKAQLDPNGGAAAAALTGAADGLRTISTVLAGLNQRIEFVLGNLTRAETWYDTVMQSFEERYARSMKTWGLVISFIVVMLLNANFFNVYRNISTSDVLRDSVLQSSDAIAKEIASRASDPNTQVSDTVEKWYKETKNQITNDTSLYTGLGFTPLQWQSVRQWMSHTGDGDWWRQLMHSLFGWLIMTLLLSVGAPFWQDVLESLFGLKNVLRQKSGTKNVEGQSGQGQPKP